MVLLEVPQCQFVIFKGIRLQVANNMKIPVSVLIAVSLLQAGELGAIQQLSPGNRHRNRPMAGGRIQSRFPRIQAVDELNRTLQVAQILNQAIVTLDILSDRFGHGIRDQAHELSDLFEPQAAQHCGLGDGTR